MLRQNIHVSFERGVNLLLGGAPSDTSESFAYNSAICATRKAHSFKGVLATKYFLKCSNECTPSCTAGGHEGTIDIKQ